MNRLNVTFLWHMHQPYYRDVLTGVASMPWVRLHACKAYMDMAAMAEAHPVKMVVNMAPSLIMQLEEYSSGHGDLYLDISRKPVSELSEDERVFVVSKFFSANADTMIRPYPRYKNLHDKRRHGGWLPPKNVVDRFRDGELRDLIVWFHLAWTGYTMRREKEALGEMIKKGWDFSEEEKNEVLDACLEGVNEIIPRLKRLQEDGKVELTTTPLFHPILPLLVDTDIARRCMPRAILPDPPYSFPEDAYAQIEAGRDYFASVFGRAPLGMWPSEGSVAPEIMPLLRKAGFSWFATDEDILLNTINSRDRVNNIYHPWLMNSGNGDAPLWAFFRDRGLADLVGFDYPRMNEADAANDLMGRLKSIRQHTRAWAKPPLVLIALDGENPWEYYPKGGEEFLNIVYSALAENPEMETALPSEYLTKYSHKSGLDTIHSGSWIRHDFSVWIGGHEENEAWKKLRQTREYFRDKLSQSRPVSAKSQNILAFIRAVLENLAVAMSRKSLFAAEGSDWFWWFGDEYASDNDDEFDRMFRRHLSNVYRCLSEVEPSELKESIARPHPVKPEYEPVAFLHPTIDGRVTEYYEWNDGGKFAIRAVGSAMYTREVYLESVYYGFDAANFYLRLDRRELAWRETAESGENNNNHANGPVMPSPEFVRVNLRAHNSNPNEEDSPTVYRVETPARPGEELPLKIYRGEDESGETPRPPAKAAAQNIMEICVPFDALGLKSGQTVRFSISLHCKDREMDRYPKSGYLTFTVPDEDFERKMWSA